MEMWGRAAVAAYFDESPDFAGVIRHGLSVPRLGAG